MSAFFTKPAPSARARTTQVKATAPQSKAQPQYSFEHLAQCGDEIHQVAQAILNTTFQDKQ